MWSRQTQFNKVDLIQLDTGYGVWREPVLNTGLVSLGHEERARAGFGAVLAMCSSARSSAFQWRRRVTYELIWVSSIGKAARMADLAW